MPRYNVTAHANGERTSTVPGWEVTYPATCNGHLGDIGFVASTGRGGSNFVYFDGDGEPYGYLITRAARARLKAMRRDFRLRK